MKVSYPEKKEQLSYGRYLISNYNTWHGGISRFIYMNMQQNYANVSVLRVR